MSVLDSLQTRAAAHPAHLILSEGFDPRIASAAVRAVDAGLGQITLVGDTAEVTHQLTKIGAAPSEMLHIADPSTSSLTAEVAEMYFELRKQVCF